MSTTQPTHIFIVENNKHFVKMLDYVFTKDLSHRFIDFTTCEECVRNMHFEPSVVVLDSGLHDYRTVLNRIKKKTPKPHVILLTRQRINETADPHTVVDDFLDMNVNNESHISEKIEYALNRIMPGRGRATAN